jgi:hypothetical protein
MASSGLNAQEIRNTGTEASRLSYDVQRLKLPMKAGAKWNGQEWKNISEVKIRNYMGKVPAFKPEAEAKMMYDDEYLYVIFRVKDKYVISKTVTINGPVWTDSAVEFFFSPDTASRINYFNLEINGGGTPLLGHQGNRPVVEDIQRIAIEHSLPKVVDPEITKKITWTISFRIPISMIAKYSKVTQPAKGVSWGANFFKIAEKSSNPHYITWSPVINEKPNFHMPQFFGKINFQ